MRVPAAKQAKRSIKLFHLGIAKGEGHARSGGCEVFKYVGGSFARDCRVLRFLGGAR